MLDDQIDEVARQLTGGEAPADLRARVLARIDSRLEPRRWRMWPAAAALGGLALVLLSVRVMRPPEDAPTAIRENRRTATQEAVVPPIASGAETARASLLPEPSLALAGAPGRAAAALQRRPRQTLPPPVEASRFADGVAGDMLPPPESIAIEPLALEPLPAAESLAEDSIAVAALDISPIEMQIMDRQ